MAINEWKIWQKLGIVKPVEEEIDVDKDLAVIISFIKEAAPLMKKLLKLSLEMKELRKREAQLRKAKASTKVIKNIILQQVKKYDEILKAYEFYELDVDVNGERIKKISTFLGKAAKEAAIEKKWLNIIRKSERWTFDW